jgi:pyruvate dehydrogenase phosphatase
MFQCRQFCIAQRRAVLLRQVVPLPRYLATTGSKSKPSSSSKGSSPNQSSNSTSSSSSIGSNSVSPGNKQRARDWFIVAASGSVAVGGAWWYLKVYSFKPASTEQSRSFSLSSPIRSSFSIPVRKSSDRSQSDSKIITSLLSEEVDARLRENEKSTRVERPASACLVERYDTNTLASNDPIEDRRAEVIVERDRAVEGAKSSHNGDLGFFAVMDGHAGYDTSTLLSNKVCG